MKDFISGQVQAYTKITMIHLLICITQIDNNTHMQYMAGGPQKVQAGLDLRAQWAQPD
jgi:hypothetical protein